MSYIKRNKTAVFLVLAACSLVLVLQTAFSDKKTALERTQTYCLENIKLFQAQLDTFQDLSRQQATRKQLVERFKKARIDFKRFEFFLEYMDNRRHPFFNGANAVEMDDGYNPNAKPEGLQVLEAELFTDSLDYERIVFLTKQLKYRALSFYLYLKDSKLKDTYIFESLRFHLIRMETLSLVSFDSPEIRNNVKEMVTTLQTIHTILSFYRDERNDAAISSLQLDIKSSIAYLSFKDFNSLDRLLFIRKYLQPLAKGLSNVQQKQKVPYLEEYNKLFRVVNLKSTTIYDTAFINPRFFAQDKYYKDNPLYAELGKKLFFDKRLSADGSMSCGTCHQPQNFFTDRLPTAITNKTGEFQKRNTPSLLNVAFQASYFYDFAAVTLESQVDHVVVNPLEFNHSYDEILKRISSDTQYVRLFAAAFPEFKQETVSIYGINTCISEFQRKMIFLNSPFDKYMRGQTTTLDASVKRGFNLFMGKAQCGSCHFAPTYYGLTPPFYGTSESEVLGVIQTFDTIHPVLDDDIGRFKNFEIDQFKFSFKTSTVRNAQLTAPYMHNGSFRTLEEVIEFYNMGGGAGMKLDVPNQTLPDNRLNLTKQDKKDIISFMNALTDTTGISRFKL
ncbi:MAG: hypothetical protein IPM95_01565 [Sphingobacteriales bacterium]|nr:hypothetical protein [Sphingobacteriales bacterium]